MPSFSIDLDIPPNEAFSEIQQCIGDVDYKVKTIIPNQSVIAEGGRDFNWIIVIILAILLWPAAIVYYFTRQRSSITATITKNDEKSCNLTVNSNGEYADHLMDLILDVFEGDEKPKSETDSSSQDKSKQDSENS